MTHCYGFLGHNPKAGGLMHASASPGANYSPEELVVIRMIARKDLGSAFP